jgi:hypothetical protein
MHSASLLKFWFTLSGRAVSWEYTTYDPAPPQKSYRWSPANVCKEKTAIVKKFKVGRPDEIVQGFISSCSKACKANILAAFAPLRRLQPKVAGI